MRELQALAEKIKVPEFQLLRRHELIFKMLQVQTEQNGMVFARGCLEILPDGYGFLRTNNYLPSSEDVYVSQTQIRRFGLLTGDTILGQVRPPKEGSDTFL